MRAGENMGVGKGCNGAPRAVPGVGRDRPGSAKEKDERGFERRREGREKVSRGKGEVEEGVSVRGFGGERRKGRDTEFVDEVGSGTAS